ncbi:MAG: type IV secretion system DNA-binding domain-containing protein [bacterium]|nr:type IV secretion system DNA-binding domain-containing protein [bacterium]
MSLDNLIFYIFTLLAFAFVAWALFFWWYLKSKRMRDVSGGLGLQLFLISAPEGTLIEKGGDEQQIIKNFISKMEQFLSGLVSIKKEGIGSSLWKQPVFTLEIAAHNRGTEIFFYVAFPRIYDKLLESRLHGAFPDAKIEKVEDYNIFNSAGATAGGIVTSAMTEILPIKTYQNLTSDPLETVTAPFSKIDEYGEGAAVQIVLRPDAKHVAERAHEAAIKVKEGKSRKEVFGEDQAMREIKKFIKPSKPEDKKQSAGHDEGLAKLLEEKGGKVIFECNIRFLASATNAEKADAIARNLSASFQQFQNPEGNSLKPKELSGAKLRSLIEKFSFRTFDESNMIHLNIEEIASIYHFPYMKKSASTVRMLHAQEAAPPVNLPKEGILIGESKYRGETKNIFIKKDDRRRHFYSIGQTGTGKSTLMQKMIIQDIQNGEGVAVIDPHGDLIDKILGHIPKERAEDVIYFDPGDIQHPMGLNMLEFDPRYPEQRSLIVNELLEIFNKLFNMSVAGGPMFEQYFRNATMLVMEDPASGNTLLEIVRVLSDKVFRDYKLSKSKNIVVDTFWKQIAEKAGGESALANMVPYVVSKLDTFLANEIMRPIIAQEHSAFNVRDVMDQKKILLLNLSKGKLGDINSSLLGLIMVGKILMAALSRVDTPESERKDFYLYIDEFQNVTTKSIATILSEARKYKLNMAITHQFIGQLEEEIKKSVFGNVGTICSFRIGSDDAEYMEKQFAPVFAAKDLLNIDNLNAYIKLLIDGQTSKPFNMFIPFPPKGNDEIAGYIKQLSRQKYSRPREEVEEEIRKRHQALNKPADA